MTIDQKQIADFKFNLGPVRVGGGDIIVAHVRFDDRNGHQSFSITGSIYGTQYARGEERVTAFGRNWYLHSCGCVHDEVAKAFPKLAPFIKWHLTSTDGPMHYVANGLYWAGFSGWTDGNAGSPPNRKFLESTIVYGALENDGLTDLGSLSKEQLEQWLTDRLPALQEAFMGAMEAVKQLAL